MATPTKRQKAAPAPNKGQREIIRKHLSAGMLRYMASLNFNPDNR